MKIADYFQGQWTVIKFDGRPIKLVGFDMTNGHSEDAGVNFIMRGDRLEWAVVRIANHLEGEARHSALMHELYHLRVAELRNRRHFVRHEREAAKLVNQIYGPEILGQYADHQKYYSSVGEEALVRLAEAYSSGVKFDATRHMKELLHSITEPRGNLAALNMAMVSAVLSGIFVLQSI